jgi:hypothetical protein
VTPNSPPQRTEKEKDPSVADQPVRTLGHDAGCNAEDSPSADSEMLLKAAWTRRGPGQVAEENLIRDNKASPGGPE